MGTESGDEAIEDVGGKRLTVGHGVNRVGRRDRHHCRLVIGAVEIGLDDHKVAIARHRGKRLLLKRLAGPTGEAMRRYGPGAIAPRDLRQQQNNRRTCPRKNGAARASPGGIIAGVRPQLWGRRATRTWGAATRVG